MANPKNTSIYIDSHGELSIRHSDKLYTPTGTQSLIRVKYSAVNPADIRHHYMGISNHVVGYEWLGTVVEVGPESPFRIGQTLFGMASVGNERPLSAGAHQDFLLAEKNWTFPLPNGLDELTAVSFLVAAQTSMDALFNCMGYAFPSAGVAGEDPTDMPILIWGGGSALGQAAVQLAAAAGFGPVITTASSSKYEMLRELGATHCFDYNSASVEQDIRSAIAASGKELTSVYDTVGAGMGFADGLSEAEMKTIRSRFSESSAAKAKRCCSSTTKPLRLVNTLLVEQDPNWIFPLPYRIGTGEGMPSKEYFKGIEWFFDNIDTQHGDDIAKIRQWCLKDGGKNWKPMKTRIVRGEDAAVDAIKRVFRGESGGEKIVIEHAFSTV